MAAILGPSTQAGSDMRHEQAIQRLAKINVTRPVRFVFGAMLYHILRLARRPLGDKEFSEGGVKFWGSAKFCEDCALAVEFIKENECPLATPFFQLRLAIWENPRAYFHVGRLFSTGTYSSWGTDGMIAYLFFLMTLRRYLPNDILKVCPKTKGYQELTRLACQEAACLAEQWSLPAELIEAFRAEEKKPL